MAGALPEPGAQLCSLLGLRLGQAQVRLQGLVRREKAPQAQSHSQVAMVPLLLLVGLGRGRAQAPREACLSAAARLHVTIRGSAAGGEGCAASRARKA